MSIFLELNASITKRREDGFFDLDKDKEAVKEYMKHVKENSMKFPDSITRLRWLVDNNYYYNVFEKYSEEELIDFIFNTIAEMPVEHHDSFMGASAFYQDYALKTNDKKMWLENYREHCQIVALYLADGNIDYALNLAEIMLKKQYTPATPVFTNAGRKRGGMLISCFLLSVDDSLNAIFNSISTSAQLSKVGGGVAVNLSNIRAMGSTIKDIEGVASGVIPVTKLLEDTFSYANQLGTRPGAGVANLNIFHRDILDFLGTKKINTDEKTRLKTLSIGLIVPDLFIELVKENADIFTFDPYEVKKITGNDFDSIIWTKELYALLLFKGAGKKLDLTARQLLTEIEKTRLESGYPYYTFIDNANKAHNLNGLGMIKQSNLCQEIFELQETTVIKDVGEATDYKRDVLCNLGSLSIPQVMKSGDFPKIVGTAIRALSQVSKITHIPNAPTINNANDSLHAVGLGAMGLHGYLASVGINYESDEAKDFADVFFATVRYYAIRESMLIAKELGETFDGFNKSDYANGKVFEPYIDTYYEANSIKVAELFKDIHIPTCVDWARLKSDVNKYGMYNGYLMACAPNASISYLFGITPSIMPINQKIETRTKGNRTTYFPMPNLSPTTQWYYKEAHNIDQYKLIDLVATIQKHVDQGISCTLFAPRDVSTRDLAKYAVYAHKKGLKSLYYLRVYNSGDIAECLSCSV